MTTQTGNNFISSFSSWLIDSDATDHICSSLTYFTSYHRINPISVKLPNGNQVIAFWKCFSQSKSCDRQCFVYSLLHF